MSKKNTKKVNPGKVNPELPSPQEFVLNQKNAVDFIKYPNNDRKLLNMGVLWHKVIIHNVNSANREVVLKDILNAVHPNDLIPVNFKVDGKNAHFMARNCGAAIDQLCRDNLIVKSSNGQSYILTIILGFSNTTETQLNVQSNISDTINKRFNTTTKVLNLDAFHKDSDLSDLIFCTLSQPKILYFVLYLAKPLNIHSLKLSNNEIRTPLEKKSPLEILWGFKLLTSLDLRNNLIENMSGLQVLKTMKITELWLDGNPVCNNYNEINYIQAVKEICPTIEKLDGMMVSLKGFQAFRRNYAVSIDCQKFIDQFLSHFFTLYDSGNRKNLVGLYNKDSIFSISCNYVFDQSTSQTVRLDNYKKYSRNLLKMVDFSKSCQDIVYGDKNIIDLLCQLSHTEHDPYTFTVDVVHYTTQSVVLIVTGAFREPGRTLNEIEGLFGFSRTFVLQAIENGEYVIINEMLHVTNATNSLANRAFKVVRVSGPPNLTNSLVIKDPSERSDVVLAFSKITSLNKFWARKYLEDTRWDFKLALEVFVDMYKSEKVNPSAFKNPSDFSTQS